MSLPLQAIERIFERLTAAYGRQFVDMYADIDTSSVKTAWGAELEPFSSREGMQRIAWALSNLPDRAPNAPAFRALCRQAPAPDAPKLPEPKADPERMRAELAKLGGIKSTAANETVDRKAWAKQLIARHEAGEKIRPISLLFAKQALGLTREAAPTRGRAA